MKKTIIISHPKLAESTVQSFLLEGLSQLTTGPEVIKVDQLLSAGEFDIKATQKNILDSSEIVFQFPLYWYSAPSSLALFQEQVFTDKFVHTLQEKNKVEPAKLSLVVSLADKQSDFGAGAKIGRTLSELLSPFQAFAEKLGFEYKKPFIIDQFNYQTPKKQQLILVDYLLYIAGSDGSFVDRSSWLLEQLKTMEQTQNIAVLADYLERQIEEYKVLNATLMEIKNDRE